VPDQGPHAGGIDSGWNAPVRHQVSASEPTADADLVGDAAHRYRRAFLSHSHDDRVKVLTYAQLLEAAGITYFQDIASLRAMENWESRLHEAIDQCDLFLLFWTGSAARSEWVERETRYALARQTSSGREDAGTSCRFFWSRMRPVHPSG